MRPETLTRLLDKVVSDTTRVDVGLKSGARFFGCVDTGLDDSALIYTQDTRQGLTDKYVVYVSIEDIEYIKRSVK